MKRTSRREIGPEDMNELFRGAKRVDVERPVHAMTSILSVRMSRELFRALSIAAKERSRGPATFARELIEQGLVLEGNAPLTIFWRLLGRISEEVRELQVTTEVPRFRWHEEQSWPRNLGRISSKTTTVAAGEAKQLQIQ